MKINVFVVLAAAVLAACSGSDSPSAKDASQPSRNKHIRGFTYYTDAMQMADQSFVWSQDVFDGYRHMDENKLPKAVRNISSSGCEVPQRLPHQKAHIVHIYQSMHKSPFYTIKPKRHLAKKAKDYAKAYARYKGEIPSDQYFAAGTSIPIANVVVTETTPTILVLVSQQDVIWNFHVAEGAKLEQVVLLSRDNVGYANIPASVKVHQLFGAGLNRCGINLHRWPRKHWSFVEDYTRGSGDNTYVTSDDLKEEYNQATPLYNFFERSYGVKEQDVIGDFRLSNFLIGTKLPNPKLPYKDIEGAEVFINPAENLITATYARFFELSEQMVKDAATKAAGGDLNILIGGKS